jgi:hypothetical protein
VRLNRITSTRLVVSVGADWDPPRGKEYAAVYAGGGGTITIDFD